MNTQALTYRAPSLALLAAEPLRALFDAWSIGHAPHVEGDGHPVIVYPGLGAGALSTSQLRNHLRKCNFTVYDWDLGVNTGPDGELGAWTESLAARVRQLHTEHGRKVSLVGWSLGGIYAREVAKLCPESVRQVITLATPFAALSDGNHAGSLCRMIGADTSKLTAELQDRLRERPPVPTTSIYSESDGVVSWEGCLERPAADVKNIAVDTSHMGMATHPDVLRIVAERLAQPEGPAGLFKRRRRGLSRASRPSRLPR